MTIEEWRARWEASAPMRHRLDEITWISGHRVRLVDTWGETHEGSLEGGIDPDHFVINGIGFNSHEVASAEVIG